MKVIDLLNKISNGEEVPEIIEVYGYRWYFNKNNYQYDKEGYEFKSPNIWSGYNFNILNEEVKVIEKDKKIEYIECRIKNFKHYIEDSCFRVQPLEDLELNQNEIVIIDKINEIIDKINKMEEK